MFSVHDGQCGMCAHYGENQPTEQPKLVQIRMSHQAPEDLIEECGHPKHSSLHLLVTPISGCTGFASAQVGQA